METDLKIQEQICSELKSLEQSICTIVNNYAEDNNIEFIEIDVVELRKDMFRDHLIAVVKVIDNEEDADLLTFKLNIKTQEVSIRSLFLKGE